MKRILLSSFPRRRESRGIPPFLKGGLGGILLLLFLSSSSFAARIPLAVYGLTPQEGVTPGRADMVSDMVRMKLRACGRFDLVEKAEMEKIIKEQGFQQTGCTETECAVKIGKVLNVKKMVVGGLGKIETAYRLSLRVVDVETAVIEVEDAESQIVKAEELESKLVPPLVARLCPKIKTTGVTPPPGGGTPEVPTGSLTVNSAPSGATVFLDGEPKGLTPQGLTDVPVGEHQIVLTLEGYKDYQEAVTVAKDQRKLISPILKMQIGSLRITTTPSGASVSVDGIARGVTTEAGLLVSGLKAGEHTVKATKVRYEPYETSAFVEPDVTKDVKVDLSARPSSVVVTSTPSGAAVYLDGASKGVTPCSVSDLSPGTHSVSLKKDGYEEHSGSVTLTAGTSERYSAVLRKVVVEAPVTPKPVTGTSGSTSEMILIPAGEFTMGSNEYDDEKPIHTVYLDAYYINKGIVAFQPPNLVQWWHDEKASLSEMRIH